MNAGNEDRSNINEDARNKSESQVAWAQARENEKD